MKDSNDFINEDEIDLSALQHIFKRYKKNIFLISALTSLVSIFIAVSTKPYWKGEFDIVLSIPSGNNLLGLKNLNQNALLNLLSPKTENQTISTQVEILKSASVLMPVFNKYKELNNKEINNKKNYRFNSWADNLKVSLKPNTSVLNIQYQDEKKENILKILNQISTIYKEYIKTESKKSSNKGLAFINEQIKIYEELFFEDMRKEKEFANKNNIFFKVNNDREDEKRITYINEELISLNTIKINQIEQHYELIKKAKDDDLFTIAKLISTSYGSELERNSLLGDIVLVKGYLSEGRINFKENDIQIKNLNKRLEYLNIELRKELMSFLKTKKDILNNEIKTSYIDPEILTKHSRLITNSNQKKEILERLAQEKISIELIKELEEEPWKLITNPTLYPNKIKPSKSTYGFFGLIIGFIIAFAYYSYKQKMSGVIFTTNQINKIIGNTIENKYLLKNIGNLEKDMNYIIKTLNRDSRNIYIPLGNQSINIIKNSISLKENNSTINYELEEILDLPKKNIIPIIKLGDLKIDELEEFKIKLRIAKLKIENLIIINT